MNDAIRRLGRAVFPMLPDVLRIPLLRFKPSLITTMPETYSVRWPYYLGDLRVMIHPCNRIETAMLAGYDPDIRQLLGQFVKPGHICIDIGANVGAVTLMMGKLVGPSGFVLAMEPGPPYFSQLKENLAMNPPLASRTRVANVGLSNAPGTLYWNPDPQNPFNAALGSKPGTTDSQAVDVVRLDGYLEKDPLPRVDFIKIDVEGMEPEVLQGAKKTLERFRPIVVFETLEIHRQHRGVDIFAMSADLLGSLDYDLFEFTAEGRPIPVDRDRMPYNTLARPR